MARLNEDILRIIFDNFDTPLEWVQVSEVCKLWKSAASKHWKKIDEIIYLENGVYKKFKYNERENTPVISSQDAQRIVKCAAPFVKTLSAATQFFDEDQYVIFGSFLYRVKNFDPKITLMLLAENATKITELIFDNQPEPKLFQQLIKNNEIKKIMFENYGALKEYNLVDQVEELNVRFNGPHFKSFSGHFPNLKSLDLTVEFERPTKPQQILSPILPYVTGVTSFRLCLVSRNNTKSDLLLPSNLLKDITKFSQLENLTIVFSSTGINDVDSFFYSLVHCCPKLRSISLCGMKISEKQLRILLTLPQLESLEIKLMSSFQRIEMPEMEKLSKLKLEYEHMLFNITSFCQVLKKMPKLKDLEVKINRYTAVTKFGPYATNSEPLKLVNQIVSMAASQNKDIMIFKRSWEGKISDKWKVERKKANSDKASETLNLTVSFDNKQGFLGGLRAFVTNNVRSHDVVVLESEPDLDEDIYRRGGWVYLG